jgi:methanogenic corrinoid protein MtbC1
VLVNTILEKIAESLGQVDEETPDLVKKALADGEDPLSIIERGVVVGIRVCGQKLADYEYGIPELLVAGEIAQQCISLVKPHLPKDQSASKWKVVIATVQGDIHELGKNLVSLLLELDGREVVDLGVDVDPMTIIDRAQQTGSKVIALSSLMVTTMPAQRELLAYLDDLGKRDEFLVIVGGAPTTQEWADEIGADGWAEDAQGAVDLLVRLEQTRG